MATITAYDAQGFGLSMGFGKLVLYPDGVDYQFTESNVSIDSVVDLGSGYANVSGTLYGCPYLDQITQYVRLVGDVAYVKTSNYFNDGALMMKVAGTYLTGAQLAQGNVVLCAGNDVIYGNSFVDSIGGYSGNDRLFGRGGNDRLRGDAGDDRLSGGAGNDVLYGGAGADRFVFDTQTGSTNIDSIRDFAKGVDRLVLDDDIFSRLGTGTAAGKSISPAHYKVGAAAGDSNDFLIYNPRTDKLYYDSDGKGPSEAVQIATIALSGSSAPAYTDFLLVT